MSGPETTGRPTILCAAFSARQIAESARPSGYDALAVDFFADLDLTAAAKRAELVTGHYPDGFTDEDLLAALDQLAEGEEPIGFVYGAGFEDRPHLLTEIGKRWPILGTGATASARLKDPLWFAQICDRTGVLFPEIALYAPPEDDGWVSKQVGGCGGNHVQWSNAQRPSGNSGTRRYAQRFVRGTRFSLAALASRGEIRSLGFSRQWVDATEDQPFRYGGAVGPLDPPPSVAKTMRDDLRRIVRSAYETGTALTGLLSADFVVAGEFVYCLEINARFGATVDIFDQPDAPLLKLHIDACNGILPKDLPPYPDAYRASGLAWADAPLTFDENYSWPEWTRDRSSLPHSFETGEPIATVYAEGETETEAMALFQQHIADLRTPAKSENTNQRTDAGQRSSLLAAEVQ
ncbi:ATP-grasp domain-containing protein [Fulvimarina sp. MAC8]|uniref:ATP-grasp domain-containing protein n=1 Tax=Fulvimarina sp. MAC8 TaxID=3162874 RepID=UPI0032ECE6CD